MTFPAPTLIAADDLSTAKIPGMPGKPFIVGDSDIDTDMESTLAGLRAEGIQAKTEIAGDCIIIALPDDVDLDSVRRVIRERNSH